jgi:cell pole-organizing protein PopZ
MSDTKGQHEPSMEEILASIRRIIAEDGETAEGDKDAKVALAPEPAKPEDDVLELTEVVEEDEAVANSSQTPAPNSEETILTLEDEPPPVEPAPATADERLISTVSASASVAALAQLVHRPRDKADEMPLGHAERTLEDVVRELLRPMLKSWLDDNLPQLVERLVRDEITRLVREAQGR